MFGQLLKATGEAESEFLYFCLEQLGIFISPVMCTVCIYRTVPAAHQFVGAFFEDKFSTAFTLLGCLITLGMLSPKQADMLAEAGLDRETVDLVVCHQASHPGLEHVRRLMGGDPARVIDIFGTHGNQIAASLPTTLVTAQRTGRIKPDGTVLLLGTAAGISAAAMVLRT